MTRRSGPVRTGDILASTVTARAQITLPGGGDPPDEWDALLETGVEDDVVARLTRIVELLHQSN